jgi:hypothetical protein
MAKKIKGKDGTGKEVEIEVEDDGGDDESDKKMNALVTARLKRFEEGLTTTITKLLETRLAATPTPEEKPSKGKKEGETDTDVRLKELQAKLDDERKARIQSDKDREEAEARRKNGEKSRSLAAALADAGVSPQLREAAQALLETKGRVVLNEDGSVGFKTKDKYGQESVSDLKDGLGDWFKDEGKAFVPAKGAGGSGVSGPSRTPSGPTKPRQLTPDEAKRAKEAAAVRELGLALVGAPPEVQD